MKPCTGLLCSRHQPWKTFQGGWHHHHTRLPAQTDCRHIRLTDLNQEAMEDSTIMDATVFSTNTDDIVPRLRLCHAALPQLCPLQGH